MFPVLGWHLWRLSGTASIARNFYENGFNILYPLVNWSVAGKGFVEAEFQIYTFVVSLLYSIFGVADFWGRFVSVVSSVLTVYGLYLMVRRILNERVAFWSALIYAILPLNVFYGRAFMPESSMLMYSVLGLYFFSVWVDSEQPLHLVLSGLFISMAVLLKLPCLYLGLPILFMAWNKFGAKALIKPALILYVLIVLAPVVLWYYHAHQMFLNGGVSVGIWTFGTDKWGMFELLLKPSFYNDLFLKSIAERHLTYPGFVLFIIGLFIKRQDSKEWVFDFWLIAILIFFAIVAQGNIAQEYYQLPFTLPAVVYIGKTLDKCISLGAVKISFNASKLKFTFAIICLILIFGLSYFRLARFYNGEDPNSLVFRLASDVKASSKKDDLIITVCDGNPVYLYHSDRKGWVVPPDRVDSGYIQARILEGAKILAADKGFFERDGLMDKIFPILSKYQIIHNDDKYFVLKLTPH